MGKEECTDAPSYSKCSMHDNSKANQGGGLERMGATLVVDRPSQAGAL